jgi:hypothetical protein
MTVDVPYRFAAGEYMTKCAYGASGQRKIYAVSARSASGSSCRRGRLRGSATLKNERWVAAAPGGTLMNFTIMYLPLYGPDHRQAP